MFKRTGNENDEKSINIYAIKNTGEPPSLLINNISTILRSSIFFVKKILSNSIILEIFYIFSVYGVKKNSGIYKYFFIRAHMLFIDLYMAIYNVKSFTILIPNK